MSLSVGAQNVIEFDLTVPPGPSACNDSWVEDGVPLQVGPIPPSTFCSFNYNDSNNDGSGPDSLWLFGATLTVDLSVFSGVDSIRVSLVDFCGIGCTTDSIYYQGSLVADFQNSTFLRPGEYWVWNNTAGDPVDEMVIQSLEGLFGEILIYPSSSGPCASNAQITADAGDVYVEDACHGLILTSPNGTCYRVRVDDGGNLVTEAVNCP